VIKIHEVTQGSAEWAELRAGKYTGSNAHKLLKYGAIDYSLTNTGTFRGNYYTKRGHILEDEAIDLYQQITNQNVSRPGFVTNSAYPLCGYSPDGLTESLVLEVKCFGQDKHMSIYAGNIPLEILAQIHFGMLICERKLANLIIYNPDLDAEVALKIIPIKANRNIQANLKRILNTKKEAVLA
jgi:YqaJ-like recombinase protein